MSAHRASICTVKAVAEVLTTRRAYMLASFAKMALWVIAITSSFTWIGGDVVLPATTWQVSLLGLFGGAVFGLGAVLNGGCAISTLTYLASGRIAMAFSLFGFSVGVMAHSLVTEGLSLAPPQPGTTLIDLKGPWVLPVLALLVSGLVWEILRLSRTPALTVRWRERMLSGRLRLSTAAALMGVSNGILYALIGTWAYTSTLSQQAQHLLGRAAAPRLQLWLLFVSLLSGMVVSAWWRGRLRPVWRFDNWHAHLLGGFLMGVGAAFALGGNDVLLMHGIPSLSPHAVPTFAAMVLGIATALLIANKLGLSIPRVDCSGDICRE